LQANGELDTRRGLTFQEICLDDLYLHNVKVGYDTKRQAGIDDDRNENIFNKKEDGN